MKWFWWPYVDDIMLMTSCWWRLVHYWWQPCDVGNNKESLADVYKLCFPWKYLIAHQNFDPLWNWNAVVGDSYVGHLKLVTEFDVCDILNVIFWMLVAETSVKGQWMLATEKAKAVTDILRLSPTSIYPNCALFSVCSFYSASQWNIHKIRSVCSGKGSVLNEVWGKLEIESRLAH